MLQCVADSDISIDDALLRIKTVPFADLSYAEPDCHREIRQGIAEVIYAQRKTAEQIIGIADTLQAHGQKTVLITRLDIEKAKAVNKNFPGIILIFSYGSSFLIGCLALLSVQLCRFFGKEKLHRMLTVIQDKHLGIFGIIPTSLLGIASTLCMYGTIPIAASFSQKGLRDDDLAAFMMSSVPLNPQLLFIALRLDLPR